MTSIGHATLDIIPSLKGLQGHLERDTNGPLRAAGAKGGLLFGDAAGSSAGKRFGSLFTSAAKASMVGVAGLSAGAFAIGKDALGEASDLGESINAVNVTFGKTSKGVRRLGREAADSVGLSQTAFQGLSVQFSSFAKEISAGSGKGVVRTLDDLTTRGADFASVMNLDVNEAMGLFQSGLAGESEPLRKYGLDLSAARVEAFALSSGIIKNKDDLTESAKVQARYALLMKDTAKTQGDFANTGDSLANRQRKLTAEWDNAQAKLGRGLLPIVEEFTGFLLQDGLPAVERFGDWFNKDGIPAIKEFGGFVRDDLAPPLETAAGHAGELIGFLKDLPTPAKYAGLAALLGGGAAMKLRGGNSGLAGGLGKALGIAKPVNVFVTNPGFGAGGGGGGAGAGPKGFGAVAGVAMAASFMPLIDEQFKSNPLLIKSGDWAEELGNRLNLPNWFAGDTAGEGRPNGKPTASQSAAMQAKLNSFYAGTLDLGGGKTSPDLKRLANGFKETGDKAWGAARMVDGFTGKTRDGRIETDRFHESLDRVARTKVKPQVDTSSIERALALLGALADGMHGVPTAGTDGGAPFLSGAGTRAGVNFNGPINVTANDPREFARQMDRHSRNRSMGGRG